MKTLISILSLLWSLNAYAVQCDPKVYYLGGCEKWKAAAPQPTSPKLDKCFNQETATFAEYDPKISACVSGKTYGKSLLRCQLPSGNSIPFDSENAACASESAIVGVDHKTETREEQPNPWTPKSTPLPHATDYATSTSENVLGDVRRVEPKEVKACAKKIRLHDPKGVFKQTAQDHFALYERDAERLKKLWCDVASGHEELLVTIEITDETGDTLNASISPKNGLSVGRQLLFYTGERKFEKALLFILSHELGHYVGNDRAWRERREAFMLAGTALATIVIAAKVKKKLPKPCYHLQCLQGLIA